MKRSYLGVLAAFSLALALSGCIIVPGPHHGGYGYGYGGGPGPGPGHYHNGY